MTAWLWAQGHAVNRKRVQRLMRMMGIEAISPRPRRGLSQPGHRVYPYLLAGLALEQANQGWSTDITYVPIRQGFISLVTIMDWYSRSVLAWQLSNTLDVAFCLDALDAALAQGQPEIVNTDQGAQFPSQAFTGRLETANMAISMDGRGRVFDKIFVERLCEP